jgi:hypothetical protein
MHLAYASATASGLLDAVEPEPAAPPPVAVLDRDVVAAPPLVVLDVEVLVVLTAATVGLPELPPHPASRTPLVSAMAASRRARCERISRVGSMPSCIRSPSG